MRDDPIETGAIETETVKRSKNAAAGLGRGPTERKTETGRIGKKIGIEGGTATMTATVVTGIIVGRTAEFEKGTTIATIVSVVSADGNAGMIWTLHQM